MQTFKNAKILNVFVENRKLENGKVDLLIFSIEKIHPKDMQIIFCDTLHLFTL